MVFGANLDTPVRTRARKDALIAFGIVNGVAFAALATAGALSLPLWIGWGFALVWYGVAGFLLAEAVRFRRSLSPGFRAFRYSTVRLVAVLGTLFLSWTLYTMVETGLAQFPVKIAIPRIVIAFLAGHEFQGLAGIAYLGLFVLMMGWFKKLEMQAVSAVPLTSGSQKDRLVASTAAAARGLREGECLIGLVDGKPAYLPFGDRLVVAPQSSGKDTSIVIPTLLTDRRGIMKNDMKGEAFAVTARRRLSFGEGGTWRTVFLADPYGVTRQRGFTSPRLSLDPRLVRATYNPFEGLDIHDIETIDRRLDAAMDMVVMPVPETAPENAKYFADQARTLIRGVTWAGLVSRDSGLTYQGEAIVVSPAWVRTRLVRAGEDFDGLLGWLRRSGRYAAEAATILAMAGDNERGSIFNTALLRLAWLEDINMSRSVVSSSVNFELIARGVADLFIVLPPDQTTSKKQWVHAWFKGMITYLEAQDIENRPAKDLLLMVNEAGSLGRIGPIEESFSRLRGYGARIWMIFQRRGQMEVYAEKAVFETADVIQVFGTMDKETLEWVRDLAGTRTIIKQTVNEGAQGVQQGNRGDSLQGGRQLQEAEENVLNVGTVRGLGAREVLTFHKGRDLPLLYPQTRYYEHPELFPDFDPNPYEQHRSR